MAQSSSIGPICRSCLQTARQTRLQSQTRAFSLTAARRRHGLPPTFEATVSDELSILLETIRSKILLPAHLIEAQQKLVYKTKNHAMLRSEPFMVEIGPKDDSTSIQLQPIDRVRDVPNSWKALVQALRLMSEEPLEQPVEKDTEDADEQSIQRWANLVPLLGGMRVAGRRWKSWQWEYMIRIIGEADGAGALLNLARQMERTGLYLVQPRVVREIFWACRTKAQLGEWSLEATSEALTLANQFSKLLADSRQRDEAQHTVNRGEMQAGVEPSAEPDVIGVVLELAARKAELLKQAQASSQAIEEAKATVSTLVARLAPNLGKVQTATSGTPAGVPPAAAADYELLRWVPLARGLRAAENILGAASIASEALEKGKAETKSIITSSEQTVQQRAAQDNGHRRGLKWSKAS